METVINTRVGVLKGDDGSQRCEDCEPGSEILKEGGGIHPDISKS